jgi:hypothetical protein
VITLLGDNPVNVLLGAGYTDAGATATDNASFIDSASIMVSGSVNTGQVGSYNLTYQVSDPSGNAAVPVTRVVNVTAAPNTPPVVIAPADILVDALGAVTPVALGSATASDDIDGAIVATPDQTGPFAPGHHQILWSATDSSGYTGYAIQFVDVRPLAELSTEQLAEAGGTVTVKVMLNGNAAAYPIEVNYEIFAAGNPTPIGSGVVTITDGLVGSFDLAIPASAVPGEIVVIITSASNALVGPADTQKISVINTNVAPIAALQVLQNGILTSIVTTDGGPVSVRALVRDGNAADQHLYDWSQTDNVLLAANPGPLDTQFIIDPAGLAPGFYRIGLAVTDDGIPVLSSDTDFYLQVMTTAPALSGQDSDGDDIADNVEGFGDADGDHIPDYLDGLANPALMQCVAGVYDKWLMNVEAGMELRLGKIALLSGQNTPAVNASAISQAAGLLGGSVPANASDNYANVGGYFDFEIHGLGRPGQSVRVVIPQLAPIPQHAVYRKYTEAGGWANFVEDAGNALYSAPGAEGICPAPGDAAFVPGLNPGDYCVQLRLEDGGANDADRLANGVIKDPGGAAVSSTALTPAATTRSGSGGGSAGLALLWLMLVLQLGKIVAWRRRQGIA